MTVPRACYSGTAVRMGVWVEETAVLVGVRGVTHCLVLRESGWHSTAGFHVLLQFGATVLEPDLYLRLCEAEFS